MLSIVRNVTKSPSLLLLRQKPNNLTNLTNLTKLTAIRWHGGPKIDPSTAQTVQITFLNPHPATTRLKGDKGNGNGTNDGKMTVEARIGETLLQTAHRHDIDLEGACEGGEYCIILLWIWDFFFFCSIEN